MDHGGPGESNKVGQLLTVRISGWSGSVVQYSWAGLVGKNEQLEWVIQGGMFSWASEGGWPVLLGQRKKD